MAYFCDDRAGGAASQRKYSGEGFTATIQNILQGLFPYKKHGQFPESNETGGTFGLVQ
jgi:hypothetical protein